MWLSTVKNLTFRLKKYYKLFNKNHLQLCALRPELWLSGEAWWILVCTSPFPSSHPLSSVHEPERPGYLRPLPDQETCGTSQYLNTTGWTARWTSCVHTLLIQYYQICSQQLRYSSSPFSEPLYPVRKLRFWFMCFVNSTGAPPHLLPRTWSCDCGPQIQCHLLSWWYPSPQCPSPPYPCLKDIMNNPQNYIEPLFHVIIIRLCLIQIWIKYLHFLRYSMLQLVVQISNKTSPLNTGNYIKVWIYYTELMPPTFLLSWVLLYSWVLGQSVCRPHVLQIFSYQGWNKPLQ